MIFAHFSHCDHSHWLSYIYFPHIGQHSLQRWSLIPFLHFSKDKINLKQVKLPTWCHKENKWQNQICSPDSDLTCVLSPLYSVVCSPPCYGQENPCWVSPWILPAVVGKNPFWHLVLVLEQFCFSGVPWEFLRVCSSVQLNFLLWVVCKEHLCPASPRPNLP